MNVTPMTSTPQGVSFMVHRLGTEVGPLKQVRELLINSFEAIKAYREDNPADVTFQGEVEVCADPFFLKHEGIRKAAFCDNGIGMDRTELRRYFNTLAESGKRQSIDENFGVGAKISTAAWNPFGVEVRSWKRGQGHVIRIVLDPRTSQYGLEQFPMGNGTFPDYLDLNQVENPDDYRVPIIGEHGTMVILLGRDLQHDTTQAPESRDVTHKDYWFQHVANKQFYRIPHQISLTSKLAITDGKPHSRKILGYAAVLDEFGEQRGQVELTDAIAHWWILDEKRSVDLYRKRPYYQAFSGTKKQGHVAAIFRDELFDFTSHDAAIPLLQKFGVVAGYNHVAIYLEPTVKLSVTANLTRTNLVLSDGTGLPWDRWAAEFDENLPEQLANYIQQHQSEASKSEQDYIAEQISKYKEFLRIKTARPAVSGTDQGDAEGEAGDAKEHSGSGHGSGEPASSANKRRPALHIKRDNGETAVSEMLLKFTPKWNWVSEDEASHLKSRAAGFTQEQYFLEINKDFSVFVELVNHGLELIKPERRDIYAGKVEDIAKRLYLSQLVWTVLSAMASFRHRDGWRGDEFDKLVSPEALTASVLPRVYLLNDMKRMVKGMPNIRKDLAEPSSNQEDVPTETMATA